MWWNMSAYNESRVDSFCNMFTYSNWTSLFTRELMDDLNHFTAPNVGKIGLGLDSQYRPTLTGVKDAKLAQKLGQLRPFIAVFPQECMGQLASFGPT